MSTASISQNHKTKTQTTAHHLPNRVDPANLPIKYLNTLLADLHLHYQALRSFHWNVEGENFFALHDEFEQQYNAIKLRIDQLAERIRMQGFRPVSKLRSMLEISNLIEPDIPASARDMVAFLTLNMRTMRGHFQTAIELTSDTRDVVTEDLLIEIKSMLEEQDWRLSAWLK